VVKEICQKAASTSYHPCGGEWIRPTLTPSNTWLFGTTRVSLPNGISIMSAVFAGLTNMTNRHTDRPHCVAIAAMRPIIIVNC